MCIGVSFVRNRCSSLLVGRFGLAPPSALSLNGGACRAPGHAGYAHRCLHHICAVGLRASPWSSEPPACQTAGDASPGFGLGTFVQFAQDEDLLHRLGCPPKALLSHRSVVLQPAGQRCFVQLADDRDALGALHHQHLVLVDQGARLGRQDHLDALSSSSMGHAGKQPNRVRV